MPAIEHASTSGEGKVNVRVPGRLSCYVDVASNNVVSLLENLGYKVIVLASVPMTLWKISWKEDNKYD